MAECPIKLSLRFANYAAVLPEKKHFLSNERADRSCLSHRRVSVNHFAGHFLTVGICFSDVSYSGTDNI